jgi:MerR family transcriptional regulator, light-induced transcriptional regulator
MHTMARGWNRSGPYRAVLACVPGERHTLGLMAFGLALHDLGWRITYLGADAPLPAVDHAAGAVTADVIVLSAALPARLATAHDDLHDLARAHAVAIGGAGATANRSAWLASRSLPADPIIAAHALTAHQEAARQPTPPTRRAPVA